MKKENERERACDCLTETFPSLWFASSQGLQAIGIYNDWIINIAILLQQLSTAASLTNVVWLERPASEHEQLSSTVFLTKTLI